MQQADNHERRLGYKYTEQADGLDVFIQAWSNPNHFKNKELCIIQESFDGNINNAGISDPSSAARFFTIHHPQFEDRLEKNIKPLVLVLAKHFNWITYTSCDGHGRSKINSEKYSLRNIGLLARSAQEAAIMSNLLNARVKSLNLKYKKKVRIDIITSHLHDEHNNVYHTIRISFVPDTQNDFEQKKEETIYFNNINSITQELVAIISSNECICCKQI